MSQRIPIWPYIVVLGGLFALALVAPRGWDHFGHDEAARQTTSSQLVSVSGRAGTDAPVLLLPAQLQPAGSAALADSAFAEATDANKAEAFGSTPRNPAGSSKNAPGHVDDQWQFDAAAELKGSEGDSQEAVRLTPDSVNAPGITSGGADAAMPSLPATQPQGVPTILELHREVSAAGEKFATEVSRAMHALSNPAPAKSTIPGAGSIVAAPVTFPVIAALDKIPTAVGPSLTALSPATSRKSKPAPDKSAFGTATATDLPGVAEASDTTPSSGAWPLAQSLLDALHLLAQRDDIAVRDWAADVGRQIERLNRLQSQEVHQAAVVLKDLRHSVELGAALAAQATSIEAASAIRRVQYAIVRRLDVWDAVCDERRTAIATNVDARLNRRRMEVCLADVNTLVERNGAAPGLRQYLMLDTLSELAKRDDEAATTQRRHVAREVLARIAEHRQTVGRPPLTEEGSLAELGKRLRDWAATPSEAAPAQREELLALVERYESNGRAEDAHQLAKRCDALVHSTLAADNELGRRLNTHYRNANVRIALSSQLINRLLPEQKTVEGPVDDTILGTPVRGRSTTSTELSVRLLPNPRTWQIALEAAGNIDSQTSSTYGPVTFLNQGAARFYVRKQILVDSAGIHAEPAAAAVDSNSSVAGMRTNYDSIPLVRSMVRNYALSQRQQKAGEANQEAEEKIRQAACSRVDSQVEPRLAQVEQEFRSRLLAPLGKLQLNPAVESLETSETRLTVRSRLAGGDQLASHTPRPDAPAESLASMQLNESAVNNLLDHLDLAGRTFTLQELHRHLNEKLSRAETPLPQDFPKGVEVTFAKTEPLRIHCGQGHVELVLNIAEIRQGKRRWHDFEVRTTYRPEARGLAAEFQRDGTIELGGQYKGKTEVVLRGIFSKVLSRERKINLLPSVVADDPRIADLQVTQLEVEDGWIGLAIGPPPTVARQSHSVRRR